MRPREQWVVLWDPPINKLRTARIFDTQEEAEAFANEQKETGWPMNVEIIHAPNYLYEEKKMQNKNERATHMFYGREVPCGNLFNECCQETRRQQNSAICAACGVRGAKPYRASDFKADLCANCGPNTRSPVVPLDDPMYTPREVCGEETPDGPCSLPYLHDNKACSCPTDRTKPPCPNHGWSNKMEPQCIGNDCANEHAGEYYLCPEHLALVAYKRPSNATTRCEHKWQHRCGLCGEPSEMDGLTETDRSSAIAAFRKICEMEKHDSPVYCIAAEQISALLAFAPAHSNIGAGGGDEEGYVHSDVLASQSPKFQAEYAQRINNCEICCQVRAGKLTACLIHDFDDTEQTTNDDLNDHLVENIEQEYQEKDRWPKCIFGKCEKPHSMFCEEHVSPKVRETDNDNNKKYELLLRACEALNNALEFAHDELKRKIDEIEMLRKRLKQSRERNGALLGVVEEIDTAKNVLDGALITLNADIEAARKRDEE